MRHIAARAVPRVGQHAVSQEVLRRRDSSEAPQPPAATENDFQQVLVARAEYRAWRQGDAHASPVPNGGKRLGTNDLLRRLLDDSCHLSGLAPREVRQAPATRLHDEFQLQEILGVGGVTHATHAMRVAATAVYGR